MPGIILFLKNYLFLIKYYYIAKNLSIMSIIKPLNPFFTDTTDIPEEYFCDRKEETNTIIEYIVNGSNIVLKAPRRIGKSSLIKHIFNQPSIKDNYNTLYIDIYGTKNASDFRQELQRNFLNAPFAKDSKAKKNIESYLKSIQLDLGSYSESGFSLPKVGIGNFQAPQYTIDEIFNWFEKADKPGLIVFDEFQQIEDYPERMAGILRSYIQQMRRTKFIFCGSSRHMLNNMFSNYNQPFYNSAKPVDLDIISLSAYTEFVTSIFDSYEKVIDVESIEFAYYLFSGNTYLMQELMKSVFLETNKEKPANKSTLLKCLSSMIDGKDADYRDLINRLNSKKERNTLYCIAGEGIAKGLTSTAMMKRYDLDNASSVQNALENLCGESLKIAVKIAKGVYTLQDRLFELWIASRGCYLGMKLMNPKRRFEEERSIIEKLPEIIAPGK